MSNNLQKTFRAWIAWTIGGIWAGTALAVLIATRIHPSTIANVSLSVKEVSFRTDASRMLGPCNEEQLLVSGLDRLDMQLNYPQTFRISGVPTQAASLEIEGESSASCSFYQVRSNALELRGPSVVTLGSPVTGAERSFSLKVHGSLTGNLTTRPGEHGLKPGFTCTRVQVNGAPAGDVEGSFSAEWGDTIFITTSSDARFDFTLAANSEIGDTQIPILDELRFSTIDPVTSEEKTVLLKPPSGYKNEVSFEKVDKKVTLADADLLIVAPKRDFYLRQFRVFDGIQLSLHGVVRDVRAGAGAGDLETRMPSFFDHLDNKKRIYGAIPALAALILGVLEKMGGLAKK